jgi:hypothetical protein
MMFMSLRYDCEYVDRLMFYVLYEKLRMHVMMKILRKAWDNMSCISVKACTQSIDGMEALTCMKSWMLNVKPWLKDTLGIQSHSIRNKL